MRFCENPNGCKWPVFSTDKITRKGYCRSCATKYRTDLDRRSIIHKAMDKQKRLAGQIRSLAEPKKENKELELWYLLQMNSNVKICDNCGKSLEHYNEWSWRSSQNHIVDKSPLNGCPSVATNPLNHNVLGMWCCHGQWGTSFLNQSKMSCFEKAKEKFQLFKSYIPENELKHVNPYLLT